MANARRAASASLFNSDVCWTRPATLGEILDLINRNGHARCCRDRQRHSKNGPEACGTHAIIVCRQLDSGRILAWQKSIRASSTGWKKHYSWHLRVSRKWRREYSRPAQEKGWEIVLPRLIASASAWCEFWPTTGA